MTVTFLPNRATATDPARAWLVSLRRDVTRARSRAPKAMVWLLLVLAYVLLTAAVIGGSLVAEFDTAVLRWDPAARWPVLEPLLTWWVLLGQRAICSTLAALWLLARAVRERDFQPLLVFGAATFLMNVTVGLVKEVLGRLGPLQLGPDAVLAGASQVFTDGTIFPSGHTANAVVTYGALAYLARRWRRTGAVVAVLMAVSVGLTTVYLGTHWISDVLAGWIAGGLVLLALPALLPLTRGLSRRMDQRLARVRRPARSPGATVATVQPWRARTSSPAASTASTAVGSADEWDQAA
jgi:undecaprenyl-diphosphatase